MSTFTCSLYTVVSCILVIFPIVAWLLILSFQSHDLRKGLIRIQLLSIRCAFIVPAISIVLFIVVLYPSAYIVEETLVAILEGRMIIIYDNYSLIYLCTFTGLTFYSLFAMLVSNLGGGNHIVHELTQADREPRCCCPSNTTIFYNNVRTALNLFLFLRPLLVIGVTILSYYNMDLLKFLLSISSAIVAIYAIVAFLLFCKYIHTKSYLICNPPPSNNMYIMTAYNIYR
jgi:hypothetical protein